MIVARAATLFAWQEATIVRGLFASCFLDDTLTVAGFAKHLSLPSFARWLNMSSWWRGRTPARSDFQLTQRAGEAT